MNVNLLKTRVKTDAMGSLQTGAGTVIDSSISLSKVNISSGDNKKIIVNIFLMAIFSVFAKFYSDSARSSSVKTQKKINAEMTKINASIKSKKELVKEFGKYKVESDEFQRKIGAVKELSRFRLHELKALDYMQGIVPEKLWFKSIEYKDTQFKLSGTALIQESLTNFLEGMESSNFFQEILILKSKEEETKKGNEISFEIQARLKVM